MLHHLSHLLSHYGYGLVAAVVALEAMGLPLPGESMVIAAALYCATTHRLDIVRMLAAAVAGAIMGDNAGFLIGRGIGYRVLARHGRRIGLSEERLVLGRYLFRRYGAAVVFVGRFVAVLRTFAALLAGANRMPWGRFLVWNALGGTVWVVGYGMAAYWAGDGIRRIEGPVAIAIAVPAGLAIVAAIVLLRRNEARLTERAMAEMAQEDRAPR